MVFSFLIILRSRDSKKWLFCKFQYKNFPRKKILLMHKHFADSSLAKHISDKLYAIRLNKHQPQNAIIFLELIVDLFKAFAKINISQNLIFSPKKTYFPSYVTI